ncbi:MAG TPA: hypothetical protein VLT57_06960 [Bryobacteraceae bacterium]|nr:hypothetical protein [Bryobacteraceae bacterium]
MPNLTPPPGAQAPALPVEAIAECIRYAEAAIVGQQHLTGPHPTTDPDAARAQLTALQQAVADAQKDTERLNWLDTSVGNGIFARRCESVEGVKSWNGSIRDFIDAARTPDTAREDDNAD